MRIAMNGFGRIGRCVARMLAEDETVELVAINDPGIMTNWSICFVMIQPTVVALRLNGRARASA